MRTFSVMLHEWKHYNKTALGKWTAGIKNTILNFKTEVTIQELAAALTDGRTVILGNLEYTEEDRIVLQSGKRIAAATRHWKSQDLFAVDIDNANYQTDDPRYITIDKAIRMCKAKGCPPAFIYTTYSHKSNHHKFRVVFASSKEITTLHQRTKVLESIFEVFAIKGECLVDSKCSDPARLFYPGKELVYTDYEATIDPEDITRRIKPTYKLEIVTTTSTKETRKLPPAKNKMVGLLRKGQLEQAKKEVAKSLRQAGKPYTDWLLDTSTKDGIVTVYNIIKDYYPAISEDPFSPVFIRDPDDYYELASRFPLDILFGIQLNEHTRCILPGHNDSVGSARIELKNDTGGYIYHCYGCMGTNKYYDIFNLLEHAIGWSHAKTKEFINLLLNVEFETEWQKEKKEDITLFQDYLMGDQFEKRFPHLYKELRTARAFGVLTFMLGEARRTIRDRLETNSDKPIFFTGLSRLRRKMMANNITEGVSDSSLQRKLKLITKLRLLEPISDSELPIEFIKTSHEERKRKGYRYRINYYSVPEFSFKLLAEAEEIVLDTKDKNIRRRYYSRQTELWANGKEEADKQYVQDKNVGKSKKTKEFYEKYKEVAIELLEKGYFTEKEILNHRRIRGMKKKKELSATVLPQLLQEKNLQVVRYSKYYKELFQIKQGTLKFGLSKIIVNSTDVPED
ncbi:hypothetical protein P8918_12555 [Bacillus spizizenii]|nr:hypothetical protein [Bacillus spizizenii]MEC0841856.1 hypothetical protein [Bacillus spizizenii]